MPEPETKYHDFAHRKLKGVEGVVGELKPARRRKVRAFFFRMAVEFTQLAKPQWDEKYKANDGWIPEEVKIYFKS